MLGVDRPPAIAANDSNRVSANHAIALSGFALIGIGIFLPWVGEIQPRVYILGMESGFERQWGKRLLLGTVLGTVLVLASLTSRGRWSVVGPILGAIGVGMVLIAVSAPLTGRWPPEIGVYVTLLGGCLVTGASIVPLIGAPIRRP